jgi:hypothetical protein
VLPLRGQVLVAKLPSLTAGRTQFTYYPGLVGLPEKAAPNLFNKSWRLAARVEVAEGGARGVIATMGGAPAGLSLYLDGEGRPVFTYRAFEAGQVALAGRAPLGAGAHDIHVEFDYDGGGFGRGAAVRLHVGGVLQAEGRLPATPPTFFSINETFDVGIDTGSAAGRYPPDAPLGYPFAGGRIERVEVQLR